MLDGKYVKHKEKSVMINKYQEIEIEPVLESLARSFFGPSNKPVYDIIFDAIKKQDEPYLIIFFSDRKIEPIGDYPKDV